MSKNFIIYIGADKSGSTWFFRYMKSRPDCVVPNAKDLYFFDMNYHRGLKWYLSYFKTEENIINCEVCHDYILSKKAAKRLKRFSNDFPTKLVLFIRHPLNRAISQFNYEKRFEKFDYSFIEFLDHNIACRKRSLYSENIKYYLGLGLDIKIFIFEDLFEIDKFISRLNYQLNLPNIQNNQILNYRKKQTSRSIIFSSFGKNIAVLLRSLGLNNLLGVLKNSNIIETFFFKEYDKNHELLSQKQRVYLINKYFVDDINELEKILKRDLSSWKK